MVIHPLAVVAEAAPVVPGWGNSSCQTHKDIRLHLSEHDGLLSRALTISITRRIIPQGPEYLFKIPTPLPRQRRRRLPPPHTGIPGERLADLADLAEQTCIALDDGLEVVLAAAQRRRSYARV